MTDGNSSIEYTANRLSNAVDIHVPRVDRAIHIGHEAVQQGMNTLDAALMDATGAGHEVWQEVSALYNMQAQAFDAIAEANRQIRDHVKNYLTTLGVPLAEGTEYISIADGPPNYGLHQDLI